MDFLLGTLGFMQMTFLPGLVLQRFFKVQTRFFDKVVMIFGLSLIANYIIVFLLTLLGIYTRITLSVVILAEFAAILWFHRDGLNTSVEQLLDSIWADIHELVSFFFPHRENDGVSTLQYFLRVLLLLLAARSILWVVNIFIQNLGTVFSAWDAVVSWNKWATVWASNVVPLDSHFYPQLIPINWSLTYVLLGSPTIQFFAKALMPVFGVFVVLGFFALCIQTKQYYYLVSLVVVHSLFDDFIDTGMNNGYVDIAVAFFMFATLYMLIRARQTQEPEQRSHHYILGALFAAGAALTKQAGVYVALCYPVLLLIDMLSLKLSPEKEQRLRWFSSFVAISLLWASWYIFKETRILMGADSAAVDVLISLSANRYESASLLQQIAAAIGQYREFVVLFLLVALTFPWMDRFYKALTLLFAPYPILWAWMASYDTRNLAIFLPVLALISGYSVQILLDGLVRIGERINISRTQVYLPLALAVVGLFSLNLIISPQALEQRQVDLQKQIFSPNKNQMLYELVEANGPQTKVLTNYPMVFLPGLEGNQVTFDFDDYGRFLTHLTNPEIEFMLLPNGTGDQIRDYIDQKIESGDYQFLARDKQWKTYTLIRIINRD
jgi:hypothetical protein